MGSADAPGRERMSDFEALMWELERSPLLANTMANVTLLDRSPDRARLRSKMARAVRRVPRLRQRPIPAPGRLAPPEWVEDPDFDLDHHLRWSTLGSGASLADLWDFVALLGRQPFDRQRPLWDFTVVEGLEGGRAAMVQRLHHTITDGEGGIRLSTAFLDLERTPDGEPIGDADADPVDAASVTGSDPHAGAGPDEHPVAGTGTAAGDVVRAVGDTVRRRGGQVAGAIGGVGGFIRNPTDAAEIARSTARQVIVPARKSPLWQEQSLRRWFGTMRIDLASASDAAHALGGSVNDFFVTGAVSAAAAYHDRRGAQVESLRLSMPVSARAGHRRGGAGSERPLATKGRDEMGTAFVPTQSLVPTVPMSPAERFAAVHDVLEATRSERAIGVLDGAASVINLLPSAALVATGERTTAGVDFVCSNVRAAPFALYLAGALLEANYPIGPLAGTAFNLTTMSYLGWLFLGLHVDPAAVTEPESLLEELGRAYDDLLLAAGVEPGRR
jgi:WS/DGAT/MGAT family acyltransferase